MAALSVVANDVDNITALGTTNYEASYDAGVALTPGEAVFLDGSNLWQLATDAAIRATFGITLNTAAVGQKVGVMKISGTIDLGVATVNGMIYCVGPVAGEINPFADILTGLYYNILGYGNAADQIVLQPYLIPTPAA